MRRRGSKRREGRSRLGEEKEKMFARKGVAVWVAAIALALRCTVCWGQDVESILAASARAMGDASSMKSWYMEQVAKTFFMSIPITTYVETGKAYYLKVKAPFVGWIIECARDTGGWKASGKEGKMVVKPMKRSAVDSALNQSFPFGIPAWEAGKARLLGEEKYGDEQCWVVKLGEDKETIYLSKDTGLLRGLVNEDNLKVTFLDYRKVSGVMVPFKMKFKQGIATVTMKANKILINEPIDARLFEAPR